MDTHTPPTGRRRSIRFTLPIADTMTFSTPPIVPSVPPVLPTNPASSPLTSPRKTPRDRRSPSSSPLSSDPEENVAGPSTLKIKIRAKVVPKGEKRVLPARLRRAAGGGAEGVRDLEEMIIDWSERYGEVVTTPPDDLRICLTTSPIQLLHSTPSDRPEVGSIMPIVTATPTRKNTIPPSPRLVLEGKERIETPTWIMVGAGEDDMEEAKEEMELSRGRGALSPVKKLRKALIDETLEDTSDAHYYSLHKKYEAFERRQRIREREKLTFERHKLRSRIDLLRNMSQTAWSSLVGVVLNPREGKGRDKVQLDGVEWLRRRLLRERKEVLKRYDQLLPVEPRKPKEGGGRGYAPTPMSDISDMRDESEDGEGSSMSPQPVPARVAALKDTKRRASSSLKRLASPVTPEAKTTTPRVRSERASRRSAEGRKRYREEDEEKDIADGVVGESGLWSRRKRKAGGGRARLSVSTLVKDIPATEVPAMIIPSARISTGNESSVTGQPPSSQTTPRLTRQPSQRQNPVSIVKTNASQPAMSTRSRPISHNPEIPGHTPAPHTPTVGRGKGDVELAASTSKEEDLEMAYVEATVVL